MDCQHFVNIIYIIIIYLFECSKVTKEHQKAMLCKVNLLFKKNIIFIFQYYKLRPTLKAKALIKP